MRVHGDLLEGWTHQSDEEGTSKVSGSKSSLVLVVTSLFLPICHRLSLTNLFLEEDFVLCDPGRTLFCYLVPTFVYP